MTNNLKLVVLTDCDSDADAQPSSEEPNCLELVVCDVSALQAAVTNHDRNSVLLPHQLPGHRVQASRTYTDGRDNRTVVEELASRYHGVVKGGKEPFYCVAAFPAAMAERILPEYFLKPTSRSKAVPVHS